MASFPSLDDLSKMLGDLLGKTVTLTPADRFSPHAAASHGLIDNDDSLVYVIGADLAFAHRSGAALAMIPAGAVDSVTVPDGDLLENYQEVANVLSGIVSEVAHTRVRLDPTMDQQAPEIAGTTVSGTAVTFLVSVDGYGDGCLGIWAA